MSAADHLSPEQFDGTAAHSFHGQCEYCDTEGPVLHFERIALNACPDCYRVHKQAIDKAERGT